MNKNFPQEAQNKDLINVFIGYDSSEPIAYHVCCQSILENTNYPVRFFPIGLKNKPVSFSRPRGEKDSTEFAITRFLVPSLSNYEGYSIFIDCDIIVLADIVDLLLEIDKTKSVSVVKHQYTPKSQTKFLGQEQTIYSRKNWSSVMVFNNKRCRILTEEYVESAPGLDLHQFKWVSDEEIGSLEPSWNHLVGEYPSSSAAKLLHFTLGGPYFSDYKHSEYSSIWYEYHKRLSSPLK